MDTLSAGFKTDQDYISSLPAEILWIILKHLEVKDIFRVRCCSKHFSRVTRDSGLWLPLIKALYLSLGIVSATCLRLNYASSLDIERAYTRPLQLRSYIQRWSSSQAGQNSEPLHGVSETSIPSIPELEARNERIECIRTIHGSSLMLLISPNLLQLWDLGLARTNPKCLASTERQRFPDEESFEGFRVGPVSQPQMWGDELTFVLNVKTHVPSSYIYTINPNINDGTFKCLARFSLNILRPRLWHFNENFLVYSHKNPRGILIYYWKENISLQWFPSWKSFVELDVMVDTQTIAARASSTYDIDFYTIPQLSDYPLAKPGQITTIDNPTIYFSSFKKDFDAPHGHGVALRWVIPSTQVTRPFALHNGIQLPWEIIAKTMSGDFYIGEQNMEVYWAKMNAEDEHEICGWRTTIGRMRIVPAGNLLVDKFDQPASIEFPDGWRLLWWEDNDTESTVRYHLMDFASPEVCSPTWQGVIAHAQVKDGETKGPFPYYKYSFSLMGRTCFVGADGRGFRIVDYCT